MRTAAAAVLTGLLFVSILLAWTPQLWAVALLEAGSYALAMGWMAWIVCGRARFEAGPWAIAFAAAPAWGLAQLALGRSVYARPTWGAILAWTAFACVYFVARQSFADSRIRERFLDAVLAFGLAVSVFCAFRMPGPFLSRNHYAAFIELALPVALARAVFGRRRVIPYALLAAAMLATVIASGSRAGSALALAEVVAVLGLAAARRLTPARNLFRLALATAALAAIFTAVAGWEVLAQRLRLTDPYAGRREMLYSSLAMICERPLMGFGLGTWPTVYPAYALYDDGLFANQAHNDWAQWAAEGGLPFALLLALFVISLARPAARSLWGIGVLSVALHAAVDYPLEKPALAALWFALAAGLTEVRLNKK
jgi:O-antigen ligase